MERLWNCGFRMNSSNGENGMKKNTTRVTIVAFCLIILIVGYYAYLSNRRREARAESKMTLVQETLSRNLQDDYPATPKEVIKYYNRILQCFYNEECTDQEIEDLGHKARELYDDELLEQNELGSYMIQLKGDIQEFKDSKRSISSFSVAASTSVVYDTVDGYDFARILCGYNVRESKQNQSVKQVYLLRKDKNSKWKIYGWEDASKLREN